MKLLVVLYHALLTVQAIADSGLVSGGSEVSQMRTFSDDSVILPATLSKSYTSNVLLRHVWEVGLALKLEDDEELPAPGGEVV